MKTAAIIFSAMLMLTSVPCLAEEFGSGSQEGGPADDATGRMFAPGVNRGGNYQERGQDNYEAHKDDQYNRTQNNYGDGEMLRQQNRERREYHPN